MKKQHPPQTKKPTTCSVQNSLPESRLIKLSNFLGSVNIGSTNGRQGCSWGSGIPMVLGKNGTEYLWLGVVDYGKNFGFLVPFPRLH